LESQLSAHIYYNGKLTFEFEATQNQLSNEQKSLEKKIYSFYKEDLHSALFFLGSLDRSIRLSPSVEFWQKYSHEFVEKLRLSPDIEVEREKLTIPIDTIFLSEMMEQIPFSQGAEYLTAAWLEECWDGINVFYQSQIKYFKGSVESFFQQFSPRIHLVGKIYFHLVENKDDQEYPFAFLATYAHAVNKTGKSQHRPLKYALTEYENDQKKMLELLATVNIASQKSLFMKELLDEGEIFHPLSWTTKDAFHFLNEIEAYEEAGILCRIPNWWKKKGNRPHLSITVGNRKPSLLGMDSLVDFKAKLEVDGVFLTIKEAEKLLSQTEGLAYIKGKWIAVDKQSLQKTISSWKEANRLMQEKDISLSEALRFLMSPQAFGVIGIDLGENVEVSCGEWLKSLLLKMKNPDLLKTMLPSKNFKATLRPYQQKGLDWLFLMHSLRFGACLADDMGLGKTIQVLAFLQSMVEKGKQLPANLLILPASLLGNWLSEIEKFVPKLKMIIVHPSAGNPKALKDFDHDTIGTYDLIITTYGLAKRLEWIQKYSWNYIILDEAQAIKNPGTAQTRAIKKLLSRNRIVLTGTPIENKLSDLWSLFDFLNPGLLGNSMEFSEINKKLIEDESNFSSLRKIIGPYILRRVKTDKTIISDLPDKIEVDSFASLTKKQVLLYKELVDQLKASLKTMNGIQKRGMILASLIKFKQICNHPDQYLGLQEFSEFDSGKFQRLREICETIFEKREKVLVFSQFKEIIAPLDHFLSSIFGKKGLTLHGGTPIKKRRMLVEEFQSSEYIPYFILSVKAGGTGLNLTAANHVIHFDRWWNPAVEDQASDRAFRIGQNKNVIVHKFITQGTVEEKIAKMIEEKSELAREVISSSGEKWITEMSNDDLINMFDIGPGLRS